MYGQAAAATYDDLTGNHLDAVLRAIRSLRVRPGLAVDVGCGTGALVRELNRRGWRARGIDSSPDMIRIARRRGPKGVFAVGDATRLRVSQEIDLVTATFDVTNHLRSSRRLSRLFACASKALRPGGALLFDCVTPHDIDRNWGGYLQYTCRPRWRLVRYGRRLAPSTGEIVYDFFVPSGRGTMRHQREIHRLRAWSRRELRAMLREAGFRRIRCVDAATLAPPASSCVRWMFLAERRVIP